ncbi:MAG TPA: M48 family metalloprotease [Bryobacteraceae bacterium]|nr:M48 family metalloprotease [Bryobacteraceae bacterium]
MPRKLFLLASLALVCGLTQETRPRAVLMIAVNDRGHQDAWLSTYAELPESATAAFAQALGCAGMREVTADRGRIEAHCAAPLKRQRLEWSIDWDFSALNTVLGASAIDMDITHPPFGFVTISPSLETRRGSMTFYHHGLLPVSQLGNISLRAGYTQQQVKTLAAAAAVLVLLPFVLLAFRRGGLVAVHAASNAIFCLGATAWLILLLKTNASNMAILLSSGVGGPIIIWQWLIIAGPAIAAVFLASRIVEAPRRRIVLWKGIRAIALLSIITAFFTTPSSVGLWGAIGFGIVLATTLRLRSMSRHRLEPVAEGELLTRVRAIAARAGTAVKGVFLIVGGTELPAAFATQFRTILLSRGILRAFSKREVDAIVGHELSHVARRGTQRAGLVGMVLPIAISVSFFAPEATPWMPLLLPIAYLIYLKARRRLEWIADADGVAWSGDGEALIVGLARVSRAHGMALEWPRWTRPLMQHPSTMDRIRVIAKRAGISQERLEQLLALSQLPADDFYPISGTTAPAGMVFGPAQRAALSRQAVYVGFGIPVLFGAAAGFIGMTTAIVVGVVVIYLLTEWVMARARMRGRKAMPGRPGVFGAFSPATEPRLYDGSYDYDWGFVAFEGDRVAFRGDRSIWAVRRDDIARIWVGQGPSSWTPKPLVCCELKSGATFSLRPYERAFGPAALWAARRLRRAFETWRAGPGTANADVLPPFDYSSVTSQPVPPYTIGHALKAGKFVGLFAMAASWIPQLVSTSFLIDPWRLVEPVIAAWALLLFTVFPGLVRDWKQPTMPGPNPLRSAQAPGPRQ